VKRDFATLSARDPETLTEEQARFIVDAGHILKFLGVEKFEDIEPETHHEKWARAVEAYFMEGKAPSSALRRAFARFKRWLFKVYQAITALKAELTPEIREVMDRLLAGQEEIDASRELAGIEPLVTEPKTVGWSDSSARRYETAVDDARREAEETMTGRLVEKFKRRKEKEYRAEWKRVRQQVAKELNESEAHVALAVLTTGKMPDGTEPNLPGWKPDDPSQYKLSRRAILDEYGEEMVEALPRRVFAKSAADGAHPDQVAQEFNFRSGQELLEALVTMLNAVRADSPTLLQEAQLRNELAELEAKAAGIRSTVAGARKAAIKLTKGEATMARRIERALLEREREGIREVLEQLREIKARGGIRPDPEATGQGEEQIPRFYRAGPGKGMAADEMAEELHPAVLAEPTPQALYNYVAGLIAAKEEFARRRKEIPAESAALAKKEMRQAAEDLIENVTRQVELKGELKAIRQEATAIRRTLEERASIKSIIDQITDDRLDDRFEDLQDREQLEEEAQRALHGEKRGEVLKMELDLLLSGNFAKAKGLLRKITGKVKTLPEYKREAEAKIDEEGLRAIQPHKYLEAAQRHRKEALEEFLRGEFQNAFDAKELELINHERYRAALAARRFEEKLLKYVRRAQRAPFQEMLGKAGGQYKERHDELLEQYEFKRVTQREQGKRESLLTWLAHEEAQTGMRPDVPEEVVARAMQQNYRDVPLGTLKEVFELMKGLSHQAQLKNKLMARARERVMETIEQLIIANIARFAKREKKPENIARRRELLSWLKAFGAQLHRPEFLIEMFDGDQAGGPAHEFFFQPFVDAENAENSEMLRLSEELTKLFAPFSRLERWGWDRKTIRMPEVATEKIQGEFTFAQVLTIALNQGNIYNREALTEGYGWTQDQVDLILTRHMEKRHWDLVQGIWTLIDSLRPASFALHRELTGRTPEQVEAAPFTIPTKSGETVDVAGGYYPIIFDAELSVKQKELDESASVDEAFGGPLGFAMTRHQHLLARKGTAGKPIALELSRLANHISGVVHDTTHRRAVLDVWRLVNRPNIRDAIVNEFGRDAYNVLKPWLRNIAGDRQRHHVDPLEKFAAKARRGATIAHLGFKLTSGLLQFLGYARTFHELGIVHALRGLGRTILNPRAAWRDAADQDQVMRDRMTNYDQNVRDVARKLTLIPAMDRAFFAHIGFADLLFSTASWHGAYQKAIEGGVPGIEAGDHSRAVDFAGRTVRVTQSAGAAKDLAGIQQGSEFKKLWVMFYSELSVQYNQFTRTARRVRRLSGEDAGQAAIEAMSAFWWLLFVPAVVEELIRGRGPDEDEEYFAWAAKNLAVYPLQTVPYVRDAAFAAESGMSVRGTPMSTLLGGGSTVVKLGLGEDINRRDIRGSVFAAGYVTSIPTAQAWQTGEYFYLWSTGQEREPNLWRALVSGRKR
jgi:hypothetical protein